MWKTIRGFAVKSSWHLGGVILVVLFLGIALYFILRAQSLPTWISKPGPVTIGEQAGKTEKAPRIIVPAPKGITTIDKEIVAKYLKMPALTMTPGDVLATTTVKPSSGPTTAIAMISPVGVGSILLRQEPMPFFQLKREFRISGRYLFAGVNQIEVDLVTNPLRVGPVELEAGVGAEVRRYDSTLGARGFLGFTYKF